MLSDDTRRVALALQKKLADDGKLIEGGWAAFAHICFNESTPEDQRFEMRKAFFCGAMHLFQSIMSTLDPGSEASEADLSRFDKINDELNAFAHAERMFEGLFGGKRH